MGVPSTMYGSQKSHYPCLKRHENEEKSHIDHLLWEMTIESKLLEPISWILVSFFSEDNVLSDEIKTMLYFE